MAIGWPSRHVRAWYLVGVAAETMGLVCTSMYVPIVLQMLAKNVGTWAPEHTIPCSQPAPVGVQAVCKARLLGHLVDTGSFAMYVKSASILGQLFTVVSFGPFADDRRYRLRLLTIFVLQASLTAAAFLLFPNKTYPALPIIAAFIAVLHYVGATVSQLLLNAFLRGLAAAQVRSGKAELGTTTRLPHSRSGSPERNGVMAEEDIHVTDDGLERLPLLNEPDGEGPSHPSSGAGEQSLILGRLSSLGSAMGTAAGFFGIGIASRIVSWRGNTLRAVQDALGGAGILCGILGVIGLMGLPRGDELDPKVLHKRREPAQRPSWTTGWRKLGAVLRIGEIKRLTNLFLFLGSWALLADAFHTFPTAIILFMLSRLGASPSQTAIFGVLPLIGSAIIQTVAPIVQRYTKWHNRTFLVIAVMFGAVPAIRASMPVWAPASWGGGIKSVQDVYWIITPVGPGYGMFFAYARAFYAEMVPIGHESTFFSLFALFDRTSSFTGPLLVGIIANSSAGWDWVWVLVMCMFILPLGLLATVNHAEGIEQGKRWRSDVDLLE